MVSKPQKQKCDGNHILRQTLNDSDILNYFSKGSGYFYMKNISCHIVLHCICTQGCTGHPLLQKQVKNAQSSLHISQNCHCRGERSDPMILSPVMGAEFGLQCFLPEVGLTEYRWTKGRAAQA